MKTENIAPGKIHNPYWLFYPLLSFPLFMAVLWRTYAILVEYFRDWPRRHNCPISSLVHKTSLLLPLRCIVHSRYFTSQFMCFYARVKFTTGQNVHIFEQFFQCRNVSYVADIKEEQNWDIHVYPPFVFKILVPALFLPAATVPDIKSKLKGTKSILFFVCYFAL